jgi:hypothetical protein
VLAVEFLDFVDGLFQTKQSGNNGTGRGTVDEVELLAQPATNQRFNFFKCSKRVESFCAFRDN